MRGGDLPRERPQLPLQPAEKPAEKPAEQPAEQPAEKPTGRHTHGLFAGDKNERGFWVDVNHVTGGEPEWAYVDGDADKKTASMKTFMTYLGYPDVIPIEQLEKKGGGNGSDAGNSVGGGGVLLFSNLRSFSNSLTFETSEYFRNNILSKIQGESINILHIVTAKLATVRDLGLKDKLQLLTECIAEASMSLKQVFDGITHHHPSPQGRSVKVYHLHLYDYGKEGDANHLQIEFKEDSRFTDEERAIHLLGWDEKTKKYTPDPAEQQKQLSSILDDHKINVVFCAGGETHWLRSRLAATGCLDKSGSAFLARKDRIVWSGFSAGAINMGTTTELCAAKNFSTVTNPERLYPHPRYDDISDLPCTFDAEKETLPDRPPETCEYSALGVFNGIVFPHYRVFNFEPIIDWFHSTINAHKIPVLRIAENICFTSGGIGAYALTNTPLGLDEHVADVMAERSFPGMLKHIPEISIDTVKDAVQRLDLNAWQNLPNLRDLKIHQNALRRIMNKPTEIIEKDALLSEMVIFKGLSIAELETSHGESLRKLYEQMGDMCLQYSGFSFEIQRMNFACRDQMEKEILNKGSAVIDRVRTEFSDPKYHMNEHYIDIGDIVIDWNSGIRVKDRPFLLQWSFNVKGELDIQWKWHYRPDYTDGLYNVIMEIAALLGVGASEVLVDGKILEKQDGRLVEQPEPEPDQDHDPQQLVEEDIKGLIQKACTNSHIHRYTNVIEGKWEININWDTGIVVNGEPFLEWSFDPPDSQNLVVTTGFSQEPIEMLKHDGEDGVYGLIAMWLNAVTVTADGEQVYPELKKDPDEGWGGAAPVSNVRTRVLAASAAGMALFAALLS